MLFHIILFACNSEVKSTSYGQRKTINSLKPLDLRDTGWAVTLDWQLVSLRITTTCHWVKNSCYFEALTSHQGPCIGGINKGMFCWQWLCMFNHNDHGCYQYFVSNNINHLFTSYEFCKKTLKVFLQLLPPGSPSYNNLSLMHTLLLEADCHF